MAGLEHAPQCVASVMRPPNCQPEIHPGSFAGVDRGLVRYFTRLHTDSALVPVEVAGFVL